MLQSCFLLVHFHYLALPLAGFFRSLNSPLFGNFLGIRQSFTIWVRVLLHVIKCKNERKQGAQDSQKLKDSVVVFFVASFSNFIFAVIVPDERKISINDSGASRRFNDATKFWEKQSIQY